MAEHAQETGTTIRVDRWLWFARFFKSRNIASKLVQSRKVRVNSVIVAKSSVSIRAGDVLTFPQAKDIRVVKVLDTGSRRGPAPEAQGLYEDLAPKAEKSVDQTTDINQVSAPRRERGAGRPTKADRRALDNFKYGSDG